MVGWLCFDWEVEERVFLNNFVRVGAIIEFDGDLSRDGGKFITVFIARDVER